MRAPDTKGDDIWFGRPPKARKREVIVAHSFGEADWRKIKASLAGCGVDLDAVTVGEFVPGAQWWLPDDSAVRQPLRDALQLMSWHYGTLVQHIWEKPLTPIQQAEGLQKMLSVFENVLLVLDLNGMFDRPGWTDDDSRAADEMLFYATSRYITRLQERIAKLRATGSRADQSARKTHNDYWRELTRLWLGIAHVRKYRRKHLSRFLLACTPTTLFLGKTGQGLERKIDSFIGKRFRRTQ